MDNIDVSISRLPPPCEGLLQFLLTVVVAPSLEKVSCMIHKIKGEENKYGEGLTDITEML